MTSWSIDDAVPLLLRMGRYAEQVRAHLDAGNDFDAPQCRRSVGLGTDEPWPHLPSGRRRRVFHPRPWTADVPLERGALRSAR